MWEWQGGKSSTHRGSQGSCQEAQDTSPPLRPYLYWQPGGEGLVAHPQAPQSLYLALILSLYIQYSLLILRFCHYFFALNCSLAVKNYLLLAAHPQTAQSSYSPLILTFRPYTQFLTWYIYFFLLFPLLLKITCYQHTSSGTPVLIHSPDTPDV